MISTEEAIQIAKKYLADKKWEYLYLVEDKVRYEVGRKVLFGKYEEQIKDMYIAPYHIEGHQDPISYYTQTELVCEKSI